MSNFNDFWSSDEARLTNPSKNWTEALKAVDRSRTDAAPPSAAEMITSSGLPPEAARGFAADSPEWIFSKEGAYVNTLYPCSSTLDCASGYACVNGYCVKLELSVDTGGNSASPGNCNQEDGLPAPCNTGGTSSCQSSPNCGKGYDPTECCGTITYTANPLGLGIIAICNGTYAEGKRCAVFCDSYFEANGEQAAGCSQAVTCDDGCSFCYRDPFGNSNASCQPLPSAPCFCPGRRCGKCQYCETDQSRPDYGACKAPEDDSNCKVCESIDYTCPCGQVVSGYGCARTKSKARGRAREDASATCQKEYPLKYKRLPDQGGYMTIDGETVTFDAIVLVCKEEEPAVCVAQLECHCHADCPPGQNCVSGRCG